MQDDTSTTTTDTTAVTIDDDSMVFLSGDAVRGERVMSVTRLYHRTPAADEILRDGFHDTTGNYVFATFSLAGVWVSDVPLDINEGAKGDDLLEVALPDDVDLSDFEVVEEAKPYREWACPPPC